jgi:hypothetical protein
MLKFVLAPPPASEACRPIFQAGDEGGFSFHLQIFVPYCLQFFQKAPILVGSRFLAFPEIVRMAGRMLANTSVTKPIVWPVSVKGGNFIWKVSHYAIGNRLYVESDYHFLIVKSLK